MSSHARVLRVESGLILHAADCAPSTGRILTNIKAAPRRSRRRVARAFSNLVLALRARSFVDQCDVVWAANEQIGLALSALRLPKPLVVIAHNVESRSRAVLTGVRAAAGRWHGVGYLSDESRTFLVDHLGIAAHRLFQYESAKYLKRAAVPSRTENGPLISVGVAKRDYRTLMDALAELPTLDTVIYASSKFGDALRQRVTPFPAGVRVMDWVDEDELFRRYQQACFAVVPLRRTRHGGAGINAVLEASAVGKAVIATRTGGMPTFVRDGETGILVPPHDVPALRDAIHYLRAEPAVAERMGAAGYRYMRERFDPDVVDANIIAFLDKLRNGAHP